MRDAGTTTLPHLAIDLDGAPIPTVWYDEVLRVEISRALSCPARALLVIEAEGPAPRIGARLHLRLDENGRVLFDGRVGAVEISRHGAEPRRITIYAEDALARLRIMPTGSAAADATAQGVAREAADLLGVGLRDASGSAVPVPVRILAGDHRFADLVAETRAVGLYFHLRDGELWLHGLGDPPGQIVSLRADEVLQWRLERDETTPLDVVSVAGWVPSEGKSVAGMAFGLAAGTAASDTVGAAGERSRWNRVAASEAAALAEASAEIEHHDAARLVLSMTCDGSRQIALGDELNAADLGVTSDPLIVTRIDERITVTEGHVIDVSTRPPPLQSEGRGGGGLLWGKVIDTADPTGCGRVRCVLPACAELETGWLSVLRPLAGDAGGMAFVPGTGSDVAILTAGRNAADGVVVGSLCGERRLPLDCGDNRRMALMSEAGHALVMDDDSAALTLQSGGGTRLTFDAEGGRLTAKGDLVLEAPGRNITIRAARIDFRKG